MAARAGGEPHCVPEHVHYCRGAVQPIELRSISRKRVFACERQCRGTFDSHQRFGRRRDAVRQRAKAVNSGTARLVLYHASPGFPLATGAGLRRPHLS
jgi:hypothetical protein